MKPDKSPGPDGMTPAFFQHHWDLLGRDITRFCDSFIQSGQLPKICNKTQIVMIPKKTKPETMGDLRPISLCNILYKIVAKVLANRLKPILGELISESQSAFVPGRLISDNIMVAFEIHHYLKRKTQGKNGFMAAKLDLSKAYDRVEWNFLWAILEKMGFPAKWIDLIKVCITTVEYNILMEGNELGPIIPQRGLRQDDPLSPYLFIMVMEGLSAMIQEQARKGTIHGIAVSRGAPMVTHLFFADDCFLFCRANSLECHILKDILDEFACVSGQAINYQKSSVAFSGNVDTETKEVTSEILGIDMGKVSGKYLGLPSLVGRRKREILGFIKDRVVGRIRSWNSRFLSLAGREILLKNVVQAIPTFAMSVFFAAPGNC